LWLPEGESGGPSHRRRDGACALFRR
jgi:hypothetical protein